MSEDRYSLVRKDLFFRSKRDARFLGLDQTYEPVQYPCIVVPPEATVEDVIHAFRAIRKRALDKAQKALTARYMCEARQADEVERTGNLVDAVDEVIRKIGG